MLDAAVLRKNGMQILSAHLGILEAERFITLIKRDQLDYTEWQRDLYKDVPVETLLKDAAEFRKFKRKNQIQEH
ncbi:hypothetical protein FACS189454_00720 [Planctomycetales bacterium]|nr:hypothetical protein FACS189454_00720 [Planctomycetales bacterium]